MSKFRTSGSLAVALLLGSFLSLSGCAGEDEGLYTNISLNNSSVVTVSVDIYGTDLLTVTINPGTARLLEIQRDDNHRDWNFDVSAPGFADVSRTCNSTNSIIGTNEYGLIDIYVSTGSTVLSVVCAQGWEENEVP